jgi:hypothetical protein
MIVQVRKLLILSFFIFNFCYGQEVKKERLLLFLPSASLNGVFKEFQDTGFDFDNYRISPALGINIRHQRRNVIYNFSLFSIINTYSFRAKSFKFNCKRCNSYQIPFLDNYSANFSALYNIHKSKLYIEGLFQGNIINYNRKKGRATLFESSGVKLSRGNLTLGLGLRKIFSLNQIEFHLKTIPYFGFILDDSYYFGEMGRTGVMVELEVMFNFYERSSKNLNP